MVNRQSSFASVSDEFKDYWKSSGRVVHGGEHAIGKRKTKRPFHSKKPMHLILRSDLAKGSFSMWNSRNKKTIHRLVYKFAEQFQIQIYKYSNNGNHLHLSVYRPQRKAARLALADISGVEGGLSPILHLGFNPIS